MDEFLRDYFVAKKWSKRGVLVGFYLLSVIGAFLYGERRGKIKAFTEIAAYLDKNAPSSDAVPQGQGEPGTLDHSHDKTL